MLLAEGNSIIRCTKEITEHTKSCFYIYKQFYPEFKHEIVVTEGETFIKITGMGFYELPDNPNKKQTAKEEEAKI
jgi:hypothetical protein